jgi:thiamine-phosphate diphosphorylase
MLKRPIICAITASNARLSHADIANAAVQANVPMVQLRMKGTFSTEMYETARTLRAITKGKALLIVNDSLEMALTVGADGVHLGKEDLPVDAARRTSPKGFLIGASVSNAHEAKKAATLGADYIGTGPVFATKNKPGEPPIGLARLSEVCGVVSIPVLAIGGITLENAPQVMQAGASGVAVISAILDAKNPLEAIHSLVASLKGGVSFP